MEYYLFFIILYATMIAFGRSSSQKCNCTTAFKSNVFQQKVLTRRTRSVIFPKKAFLLLTPAFTKAILGGRPRGLQFSMEFDMYSPLPDTVEGWQPTLLINKIKNEEKLEEATPTEVANPVMIKNTTMDIEETLHDPDSDKFFDDFHDKSVYYYPLNNNEKLYHIKPNQLDNRYKNLLQRQYALRRNFKKPNQFNANLFNSRDMQINPYQYPNINMNNFRNVKNWSRNTYKNSKHFGLHNSTRKSTNGYPFYDKWSSYGPRKIDEIYETIDHVPKWKFHQGYRERREILTQLEAVGKVFHFNMQACIQRAMCEMTYFLKPFGHALIHDVIRIILTIPDNNSFNDDHNFPYKDLRNTNCEKHFAISCPYRILQFLTMNAPNRN